MVAIAHRVARLESDRAALGNDRRDRTMAWLADQGALAAPLTLAERNEADSAAAMLLAHVAAEGAAHG